MPLEDYESETIRNPMGLFDRGDRDITPIDHLSDCFNCQFPNEGGVRSRFGSEIALVKDDVKRFHMYKRVGEVDRYLILDSLGQIFDSGNSLIVPILTVGGMTDFSVAVMFNRAYISPHNGLTGLAGEKIYVYEGSGVARPASGPAPSSYVIAATKGSVGKVEKGKRLFAVAYETASGHITKYGPAPFLQYEETVGGFKVELSNIAVGPAEAVYKHILMTKAAFTTWDGNQDALEFFFVPEGKILNAVTVFSVDLYDSELQESADYLANQLSTIPAALGLTEFSGRLIAWNFNDKNYMFRASEPDLPESFNDIDGSKVVDPGDGGAIVNIVPDMRGLMYIHKEQRVFISADNGSSPNTWKADRVDAGRGTPSVNGAGKVLDTNGATSDYYVLADRGGLFLYDGTFNPMPLSWDIESLWKRINPLYFYKVQVVIDPILRCIYVSVPLDGATECNYIFYGDCVLGVSFDRIRWSLWDMPQEVKSITVDVKFDTKRTFFRYSGGLNINQVKEGLLNDYGIAIESYTESALVGENDDSLIHQFGGIKSRIVGSGPLNINLFGVDRIQTQSVLGWSLSSLPGKVMVREFDFQNEKMSVRMGVSLINNWFYWTKLSVYRSFLWSDEPN